MTTPFDSRLVVAAFAALCLGSAVVPAGAASSAASSASDSASTSVGSVSDSIKKSSDSSSKTTKLTEGDYRVIEVAALADRPGTTRVKLQPATRETASEITSNEGEFFLYLPQPAAEAGQLAPGRIVTARQRPYGFEFVQGEPQRAFFLVLADDWYRELQTTAVVL